MTRRIAAALAVLALSLGACASLPKFEAAGDVHDFLVSIRNADRPTFDAHVDKPALKAQLRARLLAETAKAKGGDSLQVLGALFAAQANQRGTPFAQERWTILDIVSIGSDQFHPFAFKQTNGGLPSRIAKPPDQ